MALLYKLEITGKLLADVLRAYGTSLPAGPIRLVDVDVFPSGVVLPPPMDDGGMGLRLTFKVQEPPDRVVPVVVPSRGATAVRERVDLDADGEVPCGG